MDHLEDVSLEDLQTALADLESSKPAQRLTAAIAYKNGVTQTELAEWYGVQRRTIYSWLTRLDEEPIEQAVRDEPRSGRPRKLSDEKQREFRDALQNPPTEVGYDEPTWTPTLVQRYLEEAFDVEYSIPSCRRLMYEAGLRYQKPPRTATGTREDGANSDGADSDGTDSERADSVTGRWLPK